ncbi:hypothetical protein ABZ990_11035, partial [Streptomyces sp. NPDC046203]|uniref:hypothetical protein n=1 Tax=Streptomyces sp. NPDC046203 TaxID=3154602 RepID=UPI0033D5ADDB
MFLTKLDVLAGWEQIPVCVRTPGPRRAVDDRQPQLSAPDAEVVDASLSAITGEEEAEPTRRRQALMTVLGIASLAETLGPPVVAA